MPVATFSPPIAATKKSDGQPLIVIAVSEHPSGLAAVQTDFMAIDQNGLTVWLAETEFTFDFRWDPVTGWGDPNASNTRTDDDE